MDLDTIPFPARHLIDMKPYLKPPGIIRAMLKKTRQPLLQAGVVHSNVSTAAVITYSAEGREDAL